MPTAKREIPAKTSNCAASAIFNKYKPALIHKSKMPISKTLEAKNNPRWKVFVYVVLAALIILIIYYLPNYFFLEKAIADHSTLLLNSAGVQVQTKVTGESVFLENIKIVKDCTGVQVIAVFFGLLLPLPKAAWRKKLLALAVVSLILYAANVLRIVLEFSLVYFNILPWSLAHYPLSLLLGVIGVLALVFVTDQLLPEFAQFFLSIARDRSGRKREDAFS
jgi:exosortase/archaeosortase family protein